MFICIHNLCLSPLPFCMTRICAGEKIIKKERGISSGHVNDEIQSTVYKVQD